MNYLYKFFKDLKYFLVDNSVEVIFLQTPVMLQKVRFLLRNYLGILELVI